jgi:hypothetical protein
MTTIRDRVVALRRVRASELIPNPKNWRRHPAEQRDAMSGVLREIGYAGALLARETPEGLMLIDGHLRAETTPDQEVPVLVLDVDEREADVLLATVDPLAAMAERDDAALRALLAGVQADDAAVRAPLDGLAGDVVLEPFMGSGTTLIACERLRRRCYGIELKPEYCDVIVTRWEQFTGKTATRESA